MNDAIQDERYSFADEAIIDSFFLLVREKDIDRISVSDVIKKAGIVRSTFYNHYENIPALVTAVEDKTIGDIFSLMDEFHPGNNHDICKSFYSTLCEYTKNNPFLASLLQSPRGDAFFEKAMKMFHRYVARVTQAVAPDPANQEEFSYFIACAIGSTVGILHKWIADDFRATADEVADILTRFFLSGILPYLK